MQPVRRLLYLIRCAPLLGLLPVNGCLASIESGLNMVLSPGAVANALVLPYTGLAGLAELMARLFSG